MLLRKNGLKHPFESCGGVVTICAKTGNEMVGFPALLASQNDFAKNQLTADQTEAIFVTHLFTVERNRFFLICIENLLWNKGIF